MGIVVSTEEDLVKRALEAELTAALTASSEVKDRQRALARGFRERAECLRAMIAPAAGTKVKGELA